MATSHPHRGAVDWAIRMAIVVLTLATAYIHLSLGGLMFLANAVVYAAFAGLMAAPFDVVSRCRWLIRAALIGFALGTIGAWFLFGARYGLAHIDKGVEVALVGLLFVEMFRYDGGPLAVARRAWQVGLVAGGRLIGR